jgi:hypothetical protein
VLAAVHAEGADEDALFGRGVGIRAGGGTAIGRVGRGAGVIDGSADRAGTSKSEGRTTPNTILCIADRANISQEKRNVFMDMAGLIQSEERRSSVERGQNLTKKLMVTFVCHHKVYRFDRLYAMFT